MQAEMNMIDQTILLSIRVTLKKMQTCPCVALWTDMRIWLVACDLRSGDEPTVYVRYSQWS
jgi:hypothetical protein